MKPSPFMEAAFEEAEAARARGEVPIGAVVACRGEILAHAEMLAIRAACLATGSERLADADLYVTLEPCPMCAAAISFARIRRLYFGAVDEKGGAVVSGARLYTLPTCHHAPEIYAGISEKRAAQMLKSFFRDRR
jgi:tRNA(Arg) A34 adenosine deaminase TadA